MDGVTLIACALVEGADACRRGVASSEAVNAYQDLRSRVKAVLSRDADGLIALAERGPDPAVRLLADELSRTAADATGDVLGAARRLRSLLGTSDDEEPEAPGPGAGAVPGVQAAGDPIPTISGYQPDESGPVDPEGRIVSGTEQLDPVSSRLLGQLDWILGQGASGPRAEIGNRRPAYGLVILIDGCSGIQVGEGNDQLSVYRVTVPDVALRSAEDLAEMLFAVDTPWARDVFGHDARLPSLAPQGRAERDSREVVDMAGDGVLVIVRNSRGVQIGKHNVQRNTFSVRIVAVSVWAGQLEATRARRDAVSRLRADPADHGAARQLADDIISAASASLEADLTALLEVEVGSPRINGVPEQLSDLTGRQVGEEGRARVRVQVEEITAFDSAALARELASAARQARSPKDILEETLGAVDPPDDDPPALPGLGAV